MEPAKVVAGNWGGREDAIRSQRCIAKPTGCGRTIPDSEIKLWPHITRKEYMQSGWCKECQDKIFKDPDEERCTCDDEPCCEADVGEGVLKCEHKRWWCPVHASGEVPPDEPPF